MSDRVPSSETDRGMWRVVAARDFRVRLRNKGFVISTALTITILSVFILIRAYGGTSTPTFDLGFVDDGTPGAPQRALVEQTAALGPATGVAVHVHEVGDAATADRE